MNDKYIVLIPARAGSRRIPGKNKMLLGGKPLIEWTFRAVHGLVCDDDVIVSTDDAEIFDLAISFGFCNSQTRIPELASDTASLIDVARNAVQRFERANDYRGLILLQPTTPFRSVEKLLSFVDHVSINPSEPTVAVSTVHTPPAWMFVLDDERINPYALNDSTCTKTLSGQLVCVNGWAYYMPLEKLDSSLSFTSINSRCYHIDGVIETLDIDLPHEFEFAQIISTKVLAT